MVRRLGRELVAPRLDHRLLRAVDARLGRRGWLAVTALRLIVVLGDALTGETSPELLAVSLGCAAIGVLGLIVEARSPSPRALG